LLKINSFLVTQSPHRENELFAAAPKQASGSGSPSGWPSVQVEQHKKEQNDNKNMLKGQSDPKMSVRGMQKLAC